jgi:uncharacterized delta-60 repeat protein
MNREQKLQRRKSRLTTSIAVIEPIESRLFLSASVLDTTFNGTGHLYSLFGTGQPARYSAVTVLPSGKILVAGSWDSDPGQTFAATNNDFLIARYTSAGKLDTTFGGGKGYVSTGFPAFATGTAQDFPAAIVQLAGGKFAVAGTTYSYFDGRGDFAVARYNADGSLDKTFSGDGKTTTDFGSSTVVSSDGASAMAVTSEGKLLVVGGAHFLYQKNLADVAAARYNLDGSLDKTFSGDGKMTSDAGTVYGVNSSDNNNNQWQDQGGGGVAILPGGKFVVTGGIGDAPNSVPLDKRGDLYLTRFNADGSLDKTFGGGKGYTRTNTGAISEGLGSVALLANGKIIAGGSRVLSFGDTFDDTADFLVARFNADGTKDTTFGYGGAGYTVGNFYGHGNANDYLGSVNVMPNGKIVAIGGSYPIGTPPDWAPSIALMRLNSNGTFDTSFTSNGKRLDGAMDGARTGTLDYQGRIVVVGSLTGNAGAVARFGADTASTAQIQGVFYNDKNGNGKKDAGEPVLPGWQAYADSNNDGVYTPGERIATADSTGTYKLKALPPGTYRIREVRLDGWNRTQPAGVYPLGYYDVTVGLGQTAFGKYFGNKKI